MIIYDDINLPQKVSDILEQDFWMLRHVSSPMVSTVTNPVKFSASTSIFVHKGSCEADINLRSFKIQAPCVVNVGSEGIVFPRNVSPDFDASFMVLSKRLTEGIAAHFNNIGIFTAMRANPVVNIPEKECYKIERFYDDLHDITQDNLNNHPFETVMYTFIAFFYKYAMKFYEQYRSNIPSSVNNRIADQFLLLVQQHFRKERFLEFYAEKLDITTKHLSRTVKSQTGHSAVEWINRFVILEAKVMLRSSNLNIQQISEELNFPSQSFFGKYFKKAVGISPKDYRNSF